MVSQARRREVDAFAETAAAWAAARDDVVAAAIVGSWARDRAREDSDVDLVLLVDDPRVYTERDDWIAGLAPGARLVRTADWVAIVERGLRLASGLEVEVGVGRPSWAETAPVDAGTRRVVQDGLRPLFDRDGLLAAVVAACRAG